MAKVRSPYRETDQRTLGVLSAALNSPGRAIRLRAVAMLALVDCPDRERWLERASRDADSAVRETALIVEAWVQPVDHPAWPDREGAGSAAPDSGRREGATSVPAEDPEYEWGYTVEVWRTDGLVVGSFSVTTCAEDDAHARALALGHAILASAGDRGDRFDPEMAATFVVEKSRRRRRPTRG